ncbi:MAG: hypothetical protein K6E34_07120 [Lachnospiraceae bacterium]|nr:hypothetical protein [Lachnospiraceae bacterium]
MNRNNRLKKKADIENEGFMGRQQSVRAKKKKDGMMITNPIVLMIIILLLTIGDGLVICDLTNNSMPQNKFIGFFIAVSIAFVLNGIPVIMAHYIHHAIYKTRKHAWAAIALCLITFTVLFAATVKLRYQYKDEMYGDGAVEKIVNLVGTEDETIDDPNEAKPDDPKATAVFWLLSISPLATSCVNLILALLGHNFVKDHIYDLRIKRYQLLEEKGDYQAMIAEMEDMDFDRIIKNDEEKLIVMKESVLEFEKLLKAIARQILAEELKDASSVSLLCSEMRTDTDREEAGNNVEKIEINDNPRTLGILRSVRA